LYSNIYRLGNLSLYTEDFIPVSELEKENVGAKYSHLFNIPMSEVYKEIIQCISYLEKDIKDFYFTPNAFDKFCYLKRCLYVTITVFNMEFIKMFQIKEKIEHWDKVNTKLVNEGDFKKLFDLVDPAIRIMAYKEMFEIIPDSQKYEIFKSIYTTSHYGVEYFEEEFITKVQKYRTSKDLFFLTEETDSREIEIYRGEENLSTHYSESYSWTTDINVALGFASFFTTGGVVYTGKVNKDDIVDFLDTGESEVIVLPRYVKEIKKMDFYNLDSLEDLLTDNGVIDLYHYYRDEYIVRTGLMCYDSELHGVLHAKRVLMLGLILGHLENIQSDDMEIIIRFACYHDCGRRDIGDGEDEKHGAKSMEIMRNMDLFNGLDSEDKKILDYVITYHSMDDNIGEKELEKYKFDDNERALRLYHVCKDIDGLDRWRTKDFDIKYIRTSTATKLAIVAKNLLIGIK
jgi:hypothetical protein